MNFYNYFLSLCAASNIKPSPAGEAVGISRTAVNGWKHGRLPTDSTLQALADYFNVPVSEFWKCEDNVVNPQYVRKICRFRNF